MATDHVAAEVERLSQTKNLQKLTALAAMNEQVTVFLIDRNESHLYYIDSTLVPNNQVEDCLTKAEYDLRPDGGKPEAACYYEDNEEGELVYRRFGNDEGFEPLVITRSFYNLKPDCLEISEEFRLYHNLYHDKKTDRYYKFDSAGNEELIAVLEPNRVTIRLLELRQFLAVKQMHLSIQFDWREHSADTLEELGLRATKPDDSRSGLTFCGLNYTDMGMKGCRAASRLLGKTMIKPLSLEKSGAWGANRKPTKKYAEFIIGIDEDGENILCSADPAECYKHPLRPQFLTPIDFKKSVLGKYYEQPSKYSVEDGYLRCGTKWGLVIDNHHAEKVTAWLGDLAQDLPEAEQSHWKAHNIPPKGGLSAVFFRRQILAEFADSDRPEHIFIHAYESLEETSSKPGRVNFLVTLSAEDQHHLLSLRTPVNDEQKHFDEVVLSLTRILIDYLNEPELRKFLDPNNQETLETGGINLLQRVFQDQKIDGSEIHIAFLRKLQELRSKGSAHRKGKSYRKLISSVVPEKAGLSALFESLLLEGCELLKFLQDIVETGKFGIIPDTSLVDAGGSHVF